METTPSPTNEQTTTQEPAVDHQAEGVAAIEGILDGVPEPETNEEGGAATAGAESSPLAGADEIEPANAGGGGAGDAASPAPPAGDVFAGLESIMASLGVGAPPQAAAPAAPAPTPTPTPTGNQRDEFTRLMASEFGEEIGSAAQAFKAEIESQLAELKKAMASVQALAPLAHSDIAIAADPLNVHIDREYVSRDKSCALVFGKDWMTANAQQRQARQSLEAKASELFQRAAKAGKQLSEQDAIKLVAAEMTRNPQTRAEVINRAAAGRAAHRTVPPTATARSRGVGNDVVRPDGKVDYRASGVLAIEQALNARR